MLRWLMDSDSKRLLIEWETTDCEKEFFEENTETAIDKGQFVQLPKYRLRLAANFELLKDHPQRK